MNTTLLKKELREALWKLVLGTVILTALALFIPLSYNFIIDLFSLLPYEQLEKYLGTIPTDLFNDFSLYLWSQWNAKNLPQLGAIMAILVGMSLLAGEANNKTMSFLLTRPVSRRSVFLSKVLTGILMMFIMVWTATLLMIFTAGFTPNAVDTGKLLTCTFITSIGLFVILSLSILFSTIFGEPVKAGGATVLILVILAAASWFKPLRVINPFIHMYGAQYMIAGTFPLIPVLLMSLVGVGFLAVAMWVFQKKEY